MTKYLDTKKAAIAALRRPPREREQDHVHDRTHRYLQGTICGGASIHGLVPARMGDYLRGRPFSAGSVLP